MPAARGARAGAPAVGAVGRLEAGREARPRRADGEQVWSGGAAEPGRRRVPPEGGSG